MVLDPKAVPLHRHRFAPDEVLMFGSESQGLPTAVVEKSRAAVTIPAHGETQSLNLAVAVGIALFEHGRQLGYWTSTESDALVSRPALSVATNEKSNVLPASGDMVQKVKS